MSRHILTIETIPLGFKINKWTIIDRIKTLILISVGCQETFTLFELQRIGSLVQILLIRHTSYNLFEILVEIKFLKDP